jgi:hypothetical protein
MLTWLLCTLLGHRLVKRTATPVLGNVNQVVYTLVPWCLRCGKPNPHYGSAPKGDRQ